MSDDEIDYMSEDFISKCVGNNDVRPGLSHSYSCKRKKEMEMKKKYADNTYRKKMKPLHEIQKEKLKEGLETPIDTSNKGFALMQKMGYKSGMSLGKQGNGIIEPVSVILKSDRIGFGWQEMLKEKKRRIEERKKSQKQINPMEYRALKSSEHNKKKIESDLKKSRKVCCDLDYKEGILNPHEYWFWPEHTWDVEDEEDDYEEEDEENYEEDESYKEESLSNCLSSDKKPLSGDAESYSQELNEIFEPREQLQILTSYLRSTYLYCIWCCIEYGDLNDLEQNCPGPTRADHDD